MANKKKKIVILSSLITSFSLLTANLFDTPKDIIKDNPNIITINQRKTISFSNIINKIPLFFKVFILIPLWIIGTIIIKIINKLLLLITSPILKFLLRTLIIFIILLIIVIFILKLLFPEKSLKELINKKLIITLFISSLLINIIDMILSKNKTYLKYKYISLFIIGIIILLLILKPFIIKKYYEPKIIIDHSI